MRKAFSYFFSILENKAHILILIMCGFFVAFMTLIGIWKYQNLLYNGMDFAIIHQTISETAIGNFFGSSIHPGTYLNDHFSPIVFLLVPFYAITRHPITLIVIQNIFLSSGAIMLFFIARTYFSRRISLLLAASFLCNPFILNISLFEFHLLYIAIPFLLFSAYFFIKKQFLFFIIAFLLTLTVREDVALIIFMFGIIGLFEKRQIRWIVTPTILSVLYFLIAIKIIQSYNVSESYKFFIYYSWLGTSVLEIIKNALLHPLAIVQKILAFSNIEMLLGLLLPFSFLPFVRPKFLLLALPAFLQISLGNPGGSFLILKTQYVSLFLPALFISFIFSLDSLYHKTQTKKFLKILLKDKILFPTIIVIASIYAFFTLGPIPKTLIKMVNNGWQNVETEKGRKLLSEVPKDASLSTSYDLLLPASKKSNLSSFNYVFIGKQQFGHTEYTLPPNTNFILLNTRDFITYEVQYKNNTLFKDSYTSAHERILKILSENGFVPLKAHDPYLLLGKNTDVTVPLYTITNGPLTTVYKKNIEGNSHLALSYTAIDQPTNGVLPVQIQWVLKEKTDINYHIRFIISDEKNKRVYENIFSLAYGLYPTSLWQDNQHVKTFHRILLDDKKMKASSYMLSFELFSIIDGGIFVEADGSTSPHFNEETFGPEVLGQFQYAEKK